MKVVLLPILSVMVILEGYQIKCCLQDERAGLLQIMSYFPYSSIPSDPEFGSRFPSWPVGDDHSNNCCLWERVKCSPATGHITHLFLGNTVSSTTEPWPLNITVFLHFEELSILDLSQNHIGSLLESQGLCGLSNLEKLNFYSNQLTGGLPDCLWNLTSLRVLELSYNYLGGNLTSLINLHSLEFFSITDNNFQGRFSFSSITNHSRLKVLMLSNNELQVEIDQDSFSSTSFQPQFQALGLGGCNINTQTNTFLKFLSQQTNLQYIDLSSNGLIGSFPVWLLQMNSNLKLLDLGNNSLTGSLHIPQHSKLNLSHLDISSNLFSGKIPSHIGMTLSALKVLEMSRNSFQGHIPSSIAKMPQLEALDLSHNNLSGEPPEELFSHSSNLQFLLLSNNSLQGEVIPISMNLSSLISLNLDHNRFIGTVKESLKASQNLQYLDISNNMVTGELPSWIGTLHNLQMMSLARNRFQGTIPSQLCNLHQLSFLDLSENRLTGRIPSCDSLPSLRHLHMHTNSLGGSIPRGFAGSLVLVTLDLANNRLSGEIPRWIHALSSLVILLLGNNQLQGELPTQLCQLQHVNVLDISNNNISGVIPPCFRDLSFGQLKTNDLYIGFRDEVGDNTDTLFSLKAHLYLPISEFETVMRPEVVDFTVKSRFASYQGMNLYFMSAIDLSCNQLTGSIPAELGDLVMLNALNFSHNHISDAIPESFSKLKSIESLDLSYNELSGTIPLLLADLNFLEIFNVSFNNLSGQVPEKGQFGSFDESVYRGNPLLCGSRLPENCIHMANSSPSDQWGDEGETAFDFKVFFLSFGMSFISMSLFTFFLVLLINLDWSKALFAFIELHLLWWLHY